MSDEAELDKEVHLRVEGRNTFTFAELVAAIDQVEEVFGLDPAVDVLIDCSPLGEGHATLSFILRS